MKKLKNGLNHFSGSELRKAWESSYCYSNNEFACNVFWRLYNRHGECSGKRGDRLKRWA